MSPRDVRLCRPQCLRRPAHPRKIPASQRRKPNSPETRTLCWRERDSNPRSPEWGAHFRDRHGKRTRTPKSLPRHTTAAVLRSTQAAVSGSVFPTCVGRARRSVLLRAARPAETTPADNATEGIAAGTRSRRAPAMSARRRRRGPRTSDLITRCGLSAACPSR